MAFREIQAAAATYIGDDPFGLGGGELWIGEDIHAFNRTSYYGSGHPEGLPEDTRDPVVNARKALWAELSSHYQNAHGYTREQINKAQVLIESVISPERLILLRTTMLAAAFMYYVVYKGKLTKSNFKKFIDKAKLVERLRWPARIVVKPGKGSPGKGKVLDSSSGDFSSDDDEEGLPGTYFDSIDLIRYIIMAISDLKA